MVVTTMNCECCDIQTMITAAIEDSIAYTAAKLCTERNKVAVDLKDIAGCGFEYFIYNLAKCLATNLSQVDANVEEAYVVGMDATAEHIGGCPLILLLVVNKQTFALSSVVDQLNKTISGAVKNALSLDSAPAVLLDIEAIEKAKKMEKRGLAAVINSPWSPAIKLFG